MQNWPLLVWKLIDHAATVYPTREIVARSVEGPVVRTNWKDVADRSRRLGQALVRKGIKPGDTVATLAANTHRHIECWYGISGAGAIAHTVNPRLFRDQIVYIINHAEDRILFFDLTYLPLIEDIATDLGCVQHFVVLTDRERMPESAINLECYEDWLSSADGDFAWVEVDETAGAGLCYTSGTTGRPKGVLYSHRSNVLHAWAIAQSDMFELSSRSTVMPVVPIYHANGWAIPYTAAMVGAKVVMNGADNDPASLLRMIVDEGVTVAAGVPTIWLDMLQHLERTGTGVGVLKRLVIGGAAVPRLIIERFENDYGVEVVHAWGLTETSPLGTVGVPCGRVSLADREGQLDLKMSQGRAPFGVEMILEDDRGNRLPRDGRSPGNLKVKGPWVVDRYFKSDNLALDEDGYFDTGDIATIDPLGYMRITDRAKDVIKSGGEWISSIELENVAIGCPGVAEAAVIGVAHPKWGERPLLIIRRREGQGMDAAAVLSYLQSRIAKWWMPDAVEFVDEIPHTATGKILKTALRERFAHRYATVET